MVTPQVQYFAIIVPCQCPISISCHALSVILPLVTGMLPTLDLGPTSPPTRATMPDKTCASEALDHGY